jgi:putative ATP-binding cassette transporter
MKLIKYLYRQSPKLLLLAVVAGVLSGASGTALIAVISEAIRNPGVPNLKLGWIFFGLLIAYLVMKSCSEVALLLSCQDTIVQLRVDLSRRVLATPMEKLQKIGKHGLLANLTKDVDTLAQAFQLAPLIFGNIAIIIGCLCYLTWLSWEIVIIYSIGLLIGIITFHFAERGPLKRLVEMRKQLDVLYENFKSLTEGTKELQLNTQRGALFVDRVITPNASLFRDLFVRSLIGYMVVINTGITIFYFGIGMLVFTVPVWMPQSAVMIGTMTVVLLYLTNPIIGLIAAIPALRQANISLEKIDRLGGDLNNTKDKNNALIPLVNPDHPLHLELRDVRHEYRGVRDDRCFTLGPINLVVNQGEVVFIVGGNGSGKTTLAMLLLGFYPPEAGEILLNGIKVTDENRGAYQQIFSAVFSDFYLFEQLLDADETELSVRAAHYIDRLGMSHKVKVEEGRFTTVDLSTGQRKRLALVSAYLEDRPVYLLDEWAADQDPAFKRVFYTELLPELKARGKTVLVITHDESYFNCADRIVKIEDGQLCH